MKLAITGLVRSGKTTIFEVLTQNFTETTNRKEDRIGTIRVPDKRVDVLSKMYMPKKTVYAQVEYFLRGGVQDNVKEQNIWGRIKECDALIHVVRNHGVYGFEAPEPYRDFLEFDQELIFNDLVVVEKRLERLANDEKRGNKVDAKELALLKECLQSLENQVPLRRNKELADAHLLKGYAFLSAKPLLVLFNNGDDDDKLPDIKKLIEFENCMVIRGKLEHELAQMSDEDAAAFLEEFNISASAMDRAVEMSYELLGLISFFTVGEDEVRAWTVKKDVKAPDAAGAIHTDFKKGFIRAEVLAYNDLMESKTYQNAKKKGLVRLEGKEYQVKNGDIINFHFNV